MVFTPIARNLVERITLQALDPLRTMPLIYAISATVVAAAALYTLYGVIYRLYLSPVARFPGSRLAALTLWYEIYYDVVRRGSYVWKIQRMHEIYVTS